MAFEPRQTSSWGVVAARITVLLNGQERWLESERDNIPLWAPVGLGFGIIAWFSLPNSSAWVAWICACLGLAMLGLLLPVGTRSGRIMLAAGLLGAAGCGLVWAKSAMVAQPVLQRPVFTQFTGIVSDVEPLPARELVRVRLRPVKRPDLPPLLRVNITQKDVPAGMVKGSAISLRSRLMPPAAPALPGAYDFSQRAWFDGIGGTGRAVQPIRLVAKPSGSSAPTFRQRLSMHIQQRLSGGAGAIAATLATGDRGAISDEDDEAMRRSGLTHLLSISGLHVSALVGAVIFVVFHLLALSPKLALRWPLLLIAAGAGASAGGGYTLLTGAEVPTIRSCVAAILVLGGLALGREAITLRLVATGALFVMLFWPETLMGPSFQLSFAAVTAIIALHEHRGFRKIVERREQEGRFARFNRALLALFLTGVAVETMLSPIALYHFHKTGLFGAFANIIAIPLTTFVIMPLEALALLFDTVGLGAPVWWLVGLALNLLLGLAHFVSAQPGAVAMLPAFPGWAFGLVVAGCLWVSLWRNRARYYGLAPVAIGLAVMALSPAPDILVTGDGHHLAVRTPNGGLAILRSRAGDYVRDTLSESAGFEGDLATVEDIPNAQCSADLCAINMKAGNMKAGERSWRILATRSNYLVPIDEFNADCRQADIVISDRRLPRSCTPRWMKFDRPFLQRHGGISINLTQRHIDTVIDVRDEHPWVRHPLSRNGSFMRKPYSGAPKTR
ncbi:MAG: ComEC/Rec2 family competence protein [Alphaproteobacteria bacterium]|nr:ComEC/Rec2 family competence protein [Alphaproteobacteria bacterium]